HTRSYGDWSSDVCSSDLHRPLVIGSVAVARGTSVVPLITRLFLRRCVIHETSLSGARKRPPLLFVVQESTGSLAKRRRRSDLDVGRRHFQFRENRLRHSNNSVSRRNIAVRPR